MNYRHVFHAGNFADVVKHALLARILLALKRKESPMRYIDTHAGAGKYDLQSATASRSPEWRRGIQRLMRAGIPDDVRGLLEPYMSLIELTDAGEIATYPGSPMIASSLLRRADRLALCETHELTRAELAKALGRDTRSRILGFDGYMALGAFVPPKERRGAVLVDPPFEMRDERDQIVAAFATATRKWPQGVFIVWRPIFDGREDDAFVEAMARTEARSLLDVWLDIGRAQPPTPRLRRAGLLIANAPFGVFEEIRRILEFLTPLLACGAGATHKCEWIRPPA